MNSKEKFELFKKIYKELQKHLRDYPMELPYVDYKVVIGSTKPDNYYKSLFTNMLHDLSKESVLNFVSSVHYKNIGEIKWKDIIKVNTDNLTDLNYKDGLLKNYISKLKLE